MHGGKLGVRGAGYKQPGCLELEEEEGWGCQVKVLVMEGLRCCGSLCWSSKGGEGGP